MPEPTISAAQRRMLREDHTANRYGKCCICLLTYPCNVLTLLEALESAERKLAVLEAPV